MFLGFITLIEKKGLTCNERFLLAATALCAGSDGEWVTAELLSKRLSVSRYLVSCGLPKLVQAGFIVKRTPDQSGQNSSGPLYQVAPTVSHSFGNESWCGQKSLVEKLLRGLPLPDQAQSSDGRSVQPAIGGYPTERDKSASMLPSLRFTLAILVGFSDELGMVCLDKLGSLRRHTALSVSRLRNHLREASDSLGLLTVIPGVTSRWLKPAKQPSVFFLDLGSVIPGRLSAHFQAENDPFSAILRRENFPMVRKLIGELPAPAIQVLMTKFSHEASVLLTEHCDNLGSPAEFCSTRARESGLFDRIGEFVAMPFGSEEHSGWSDAMLNVLRDEIALFVSGVAYMVKQWLVGLVSNGLEWKMLQIHPPRCHGGSYWVCIRILAPSHDLASVTLFRLD